VTVLSTVYFGWHYLLDDIGGAVIAVMALALARMLTGFDPQTVRETVPSALTPERA
jgi:membrane-associated phospholipid phosphatase